MTTPHTPEDRLVSQISELYGSVRQITQAFPVMVQAAGNRRLAETMRGHLALTSRQLARLEDMIRFLGADPPYPTSPWLAGLFKESAERVGRGGHRALVDAGLIADARRVRHYVIAAYKTTIALAEQFGLGPIVRLLARSLREETSADETLSRLARYEVNAEFALLKARTVA